MKSISKVTKSRQFERLEDRTVLSANVTASYNSGLLSISGDNKGDQFIVHQLKNGDWEIDGLNKTKINGQTSQTYSYVGSIDIRTGSGKDAVGVANGFLPGPLTINTDSGNDLVALALLNVGSVSVCTGSGNDALIVAGLQVQGEQAPSITPSIATTGSPGSASFDLGDGTNIALLAGIKATNLSLCSGKGTDYVGLIGVCVDECLSVDTGKGADILGVVGSSARFANFNGGSQPGDVMFTAKNSFGDSSSDFKVTINIDPLLKTLASEFKTIQKSAVSVLSGFSSFPVFNV